MSCRAGILSLAILTSFALPVWAQTNAGPALLNVKEITIQYARVGNMHDTDACGLSREELLAVISQTLKTDNVPAVTVSKAKPPTSSIARIDLIPEVISLNQSNDCTTWVALTAQSQNVVKIPPIVEPRGVTITYWRSGLLISGKQSSHPQKINETAQRLAHDFAKQYLLDQPPTLPETDEEKSNIKH